MATLPLKNRLGPSSPRVQREAKVGGRYPLAEPSRGKWAAREDGEVWRALVPMCLSAAAPSVPHVTHNSQGLPCTASGSALTPSPSVPQAEQHLSSHRAEGSGLLRPRWERRAPARSLGWGWERSCGWGWGGWGRDCGEVQRPALQPDSTTKSRLSQLPPRCLNLPIW